MILMAQFSANLGGKSSSAAPVSPKPPVMKPAMAQPPCGPGGPPQHPGGYGPCPPTGGPQQCGGYGPPPPQARGTEPTFGQPPAAPPCAYTPPQPPQQAQAHRPMSPYGQTPVPNRFFPEMSPIRYRPDAGPEDTLVYRHYNPSEVVHGRTMEEWLRFSPCYFSLFRYFGGEGHMGDRTHIRPWDEGYSWTQRHSKTNYFDNIPYFDKNYPSDIGNKYMEKGYVPPCNQYSDTYLNGPKQPECGRKSFENYKRCMLAAFEFFKKLGVKWYSACDRDFAPEGENWMETNNLLEEATNMALNLQREMGMRPLYFAADLFSHPRYMNGAATNPDAHVYAYACAQVKRAMDMAKKLEAEHFVFFNPRDGYKNSVQRQLYHDMEHLGNLYKMAVQYRDKIGYKGHLLIQPKPFDPHRYQYECDAMATMNMLRHFGLDRHYKLYIKPAWSRLMGRPYYHDVYLASAWNMLGMVDASDSYPEVKATSEISARNVRDATYVMKRYLEMHSSSVKNGVKPISGGFSMSCRVRRESIEPRDMFHAMILTMDTYACALKNAARMISDGYFARNLQQRYISYKSGFGHVLDKGTTNFEECEEYSRKKGEPQPLSGRYEHIENMFNHYIYPAQKSSAASTGPYHQRM